MNILKYLLLIPAIIFVGHASAQQISGTVSGKGEKLVGAPVHWAGTTIGAIADAEGVFKLNRVKGHNKLVTSYVGFVNDTIAVGNDNEYHFDLKTGEFGLDEVIVTGVQRGNFIALNTVTKNEQISFAGLTKMACCNVAESFENSASITVGYSDAVSGTRQIRMLGLAGIYTQILDESRPIMRGLGSPYALTYTPGMWLQSIQVSKGVSSVISGHEAISGQINLEHRKPTDGDKLFINGYFDQQLRSELNVTSAHHINEKLTTIVMAHGSFDKQKNDHNKDGFLDMPTMQQLNIANKWLYMASNGMQIRAGIKAVSENRQGGQMLYDSKKENYWESEYYGSQIDNKNFNGYLKIAKPVGKSIYNDELKEEMRSNVAFVMDYNYYQTASYFGRKAYDGEQNSFYANLLYNLYLSKRNTLILGATATADRFDEVYTTDFSGYEKHLNFNDSEFGVFGEYSYNYKDKFNFIVGLRADNSHTDIGKSAGWFYTPRALVKLNIMPRLVLRTSAGKGFRMANIFTDNIGMLATGRRMIFDEHSLNRMEESLTYGGSLTQAFKLGKDSNASLSLDIFRTGFQNQIIVDQEYDSHSIRYYNLDGKSFTSTYQIDFNWTPLERFDILLTYRYNDTSVTLNRPDNTQSSVEKPLVDKYKGLINLQYATRFRRWVFDFTAQVNGQSRLPVQNGTISNFEYSPRYPMFYAQVSRKIRKVDIYIGCENIANYTQPHPIISSDNPFDPSFNSSVVWGPLMGRKFYAGFRFNL